MESNALHGTETFYMELKSVTWNQKRYMESKSVTWYQNALHGIKKSYM